MLCLLPQSAINMADHLPSSEAPIILATSLRASVMSWIARTPAGPGGRITLGHVTLTSVPCIYHLIIKIK